MSKRNKKRPAEDSAAHALEEIGRESDRFAEWLTENQVLVLAVAGGILLISAVVGFMMSGRDEARVEAASEFAQLQTAYRVAMGASPTAFEVAEPANPETALDVRNDFVARFGEIESERRGDAIGALAALDKSAIEQALGDADAAIATLDTAIDAQPSGAGARSYLESRRASLHELAGRWTEAAEAWAAAATIDNPLRAELLAHAARCWAEAGNVEQALAVWGQLEELDGALTVAPYVRARMEELAAGA